eukprot:2175435-Amphidinium_carterae.2
MPSPWSWAAKSKGGTFEPSGYMLSVIKGPHTSHGDSLKQPPQRLVHHLPRQIALNKHDPLRHPFTTAGVFHATSVRGHPTKLLLSV